METKQQETAASTVQPTVMAASTVDSGMVAVFPSMPTYSSNVIGASPTPSQMTKYVDSPVTLALGTPEIDIPIYTIKTRELTVPISLSYHASGIKVDEIPGSVGLGWILNAGGVINREIRGGFDKAVRDKGESEDTKTDMSNTDDVWTGKKDGFYDRFSYNCNGRTGAFIMGSFSHEDDRDSVSNADPIDYHKYDTEGTLPKITKLTVNDDQIIVERDGGTSGRMSIKDPYGNTYYFEEGESYGISSDHEVVGDIDEDSEEKYYKSSLFLTKIVSASGKDVIRFEYDSIEIWKHYSYSHSLTYSRGAMLAENSVEPIRGVDEFDFSLVKDYAPTYTHLVTYRSPKRLSEIIFDCKEDEESTLDYTGNKVKFEYEDIDDRVIKEYDFDCYENVNAGPALKKITVENYNGDVIKSVDINQGVFDENNDNRRKLNSVTFKGSDDEVIEELSFDYYCKADRLFPEVEENGRLFAQDEFGYYNGREDNANLISRYLYKEMPSSDQFPFDTPFDPPKDDEGGNNYPTVIVTDDISYLPEGGFEIEGIQYAPGGFGNGNFANPTPNWPSDIIFADTDDETMERMMTKRDYSFAHAICYTLKSITKSTGAKTVYNFEAGYNPNVVNPKYRNIGIRIKSIETHDMTKAPENTLVKKREFEYDEQATGCTMDLDEIKLDHYLSRHQIIKEDPERGLAIWQQIVTIYDHPVLPGASMRNAKNFYEKVTERITDGNGENPIKTVYTFDCSDAICQWTYEYNVSNAPRSSAIGGFDDNNIYIQIYEVEEVVDGETVSIGDVIGYFKYTPGAFNNMTSKTTYRTSEDGENFEPVEEIINTFDIDSRTKDITVGLFAVNRMSLSFDAWDYISRDIEGDLADQTLVINQLERRLRIDDSNPNRPKAIPSGYDVDEDVKYLKFHVMEKRAAKRLVHSERRQYFACGITREYTDYEYEDSGITSDLLWPYTTGGNATAPTTHFDPSAIMPPKSKTKRVGSDTYVHRYIRPHAFLNKTGGGGRMADANNIHTTMGTEVVKNGTDTIGIYTDFRNIDGIDGAKPVRNEKYLNGKLVEWSAIHRYDSYGNPVCVSENGLPPVCYIWSYRGKYPVAVIRNASYEQLMSAIDSGDIETITEKDNLEEADIETLNDIRNLLPEAMVTVSTYEPLVGLKSVSDPTGRVSTYHYDTAGRLAAILDEDGNTIESYEYNTINQ